MALTTAATVRAEGGFQKQQFLAATDEALAELLEERIAEAAAEIELRVGAELYGSQDATVAQCLTTAETYLATAKALQTIQNLVATWDAEPLPPELIEAADIGGLIARYRVDADALLRHCRDRSDLPARPSLSTGAIRI